GGDEGARAVRRRGRRGLPSSRGQPQRRVLQLRLGRRERHRELAEDLRVGMDGVARRAPRVVGRQHEPTLRLCESSCMARCTHLEQVTVERPDRVEACEDCLAIGASWIVTPVELGEDWSYCYVDDVMFVLSPG